MYEVVVFSGAIPAMLVRLDLLVIRRRTAVPIVIENGSVRTMCSSERYISTDVAGRGGATSRVGTVIPSMQTIFFCS
jgi:hypothetical protein